jgi:hypothetical protein
MNSAHTEEEEEEEEEEQVIGRTGIRANEPGTV